VPRMRTVAIAEGRISDGWPEETWRADDSRLKDNKRGRFLKKISTAWKRGKSSSAYGKGAEKAAKEKGWER